MDVCFACEYEEGVGGRGEAEARCRVIHIMFTSVRLESGVISGCGCRHSVWADVKLLVFEYLAARLFSSHATASGLTSAQNGQGGDAADQ